MGSVGAERFKELSPAGTPEGNVVMSFSFDSYQLEEDELQRGSQAKGILTFMEPGEGRNGPDPQPGAGFSAGFPPISELPGIGLIATNGLKRCKIA